jgi:hypothetical protein
MKKLKAAEGKEVTNNITNPRQIIEQLKQPGGFLKLIRGEMSTGNNSVTSKVFTDDNFRDFNVMDQATGEIKQLEVKPYEQTVAQKAKGGFVRGQGKAMRGGGCAMKGKKR